MTFTIILHFKFTVMQKSDGGPVWASSSNDLYGGAVTAEAVVDTSYNPNYSSQNNFNQEYGAVASVPVPDDIVMHNAKRAAESGMMSGADFGRGVAVEAVAFNQNNFSSNSVGLPPVPPPIYLQPRVTVMTRTLELFENERYSPMSGWSAKGLLITDRKTISSNNGESGWTDFREAENALCSHGTYI